MKSRTKKKIAIVYDRVNKWGGAERVLLALHKMYPDAPLYTSVYNKKKAPWAKVFPKVITSFLQSFPFARSNHELLAPLMPLVFEKFDFSEYDLVISVTSEAAKGIRTSGKTIHVCYCLTPTRYLWSGYDMYFKGASFKWITRPIVNFLRRWDLEAAQRPDLIIAISTEVKKRIIKYYKRNSEIVFPPVEIPTNRYVDKKTKNNSKNEFYLLVSRLVGYKKVDLAISTFNKLGYPLVVVGSGRLLNHLKKQSNKNIKFIGQVGESKLIEYYRNAKGLIMPQEEDFGIVSVEAQSYGVPVIAYKKGGSLDSIIDGKTGIFFKYQTIKSLKDAILRFEKMHFKADNLVTNAKQFSEAQFRQKFAKIVTNATKRQ